MSKSLLSFLFSFLAIFNVGTAENEETMQKNEESKKNPVVLIETSLGNIQVELYPNRAPITVRNFLDYVQDGHYNETLFHRVINGFMIQGGGFTVDFKQKSGNASIKSESDNGLKNKRGTIAMARTSDPDSAAAQFFINLADNPFLDFRSKTPEGAGYTVFGKVISGMDVVDKIAKVKTGSYENHGDVPLDNVVIIDIKEVTSTGTPSSDVKTSAPSANVQGTTPSAPNNPVTQ